MVSGARVFLVLVNSHSFSSTYLHNSVYQVPGNIAPLPNLTCVITKFALFLVDQVSSPPSPPRMIHVLNNSLVYAIMSMSHQFVCVIDQFAIAASVFSGLNDFITFYYLH